MSKDSGQSIIEVLVVLAISMVVIVGLVMVVTSSIKNASFAQNQSKATKYGQEVMENLKTIRDRNEAIVIDTSVLNYYSTSTINFADLWSISISSPSYCSNPCYFKIINNGTSIQQVDSTYVEVIANEPGITRQIMIQDNSTTFDKEKTVIARIKWVDAAGEHQSNLESILTNH